MNSVRPLAALLLLGAGVDAETPPAGPPGALRIATWNMEHLAERDGEGCRPRTAAEYAELRRRAGRLRADVIAFQEVESEAAARRVFAPDASSVVMGGAHRRASRSLS